MRDPRACWLLMMICLHLGCGQVRDAHDATAVAMLGRRESFETVPGFEGEMYVLEAGPRDAPALVLVHGLGSEGARDFERILPALSRRYHVLAFDLPGLARSQAVRGSYTPQAYARVIRTLMERHLDKPACVLGHSMGGALAIQLAADAPEQVQCLALLDVAGVLHYREYLREVVARSRGEAGAWTRARRGMRSLLLEIGLASAPRVRLEDAAFESNPLLRNFFTSGRVAALRFLQHDFGPAMRAVRAPTWLGWGRDDTVASPRAADVLRAQLHPVVDVRFEHSGHVPMRSEPERLTESLIAFFERAPEAQTTNGLELQLERDGRCIRERDQVFEGAYDSITLYGCKGAILRNVRARSLKMERSSAELVNVTLTSPDVAASVKRSRLKWTGGKIEAAVCIDTDQTVLDLAGVTCQYERASIRVHGPHPLTASVSALVRDGHETRLHGEYQMFRTAQGELASLRHLIGPRDGRSPQAIGVDEDLLLGEELEGEDLRGARLKGTNLTGFNLRSAQLSKADLRRAKLENAKLAGVDLSQADLREADLQECDLSGADLRGADLRRASLEGAKLLGARYDASTRFPARFEPDEHGMIRSTEGEVTLVSEPPDTPEPRPAAATAASDPTPPTTAQATAGPSPEMASPEPAQPARDVAPVASATPSPEAVDSAPAETASAIGELHLPSRVETSQPALTPRPLIARDLAFADAADPNPGSGRAQILAGWISTGLAVASGVQIPLCELEDFGGKIGERRCRRLALSVGTVALTLGVPWLVFGYKKRSAQKAWRARHGFASFGSRLHVDASSEGLWILYGGAL